jgi:hypothetical protein
MTVQETLKEAAERYANKELSNELTSKVGNFYGFSSSFIEGAKWQQEKMYSEEDMMFAYEQGARLALISQSDLARVKGKFPTPREWFDDLKTYKI